MMKYDICIIGSGAGAGPIAFELTKAGKKLLFWKKELFIMKKIFPKMR